ncbi:2-hydroxyacid dehydrogenase (plasmid) [Roseivivax marinus]|uniref:2-hydroxyacid dehydrogenase n=1 Tax=Roseivivax marinus TaxID=1379903 RepID=UPI001F04BD32|nr:2-hydroxyacid dehydrogenase [Roseivivax marinus]UMA67087.1 2-hydroxyacid dehydrogenase [Roseivivax marinus]
MSDKPELLVVWPMRARQMDELASRYELLRYDEAEDKPGFLKAQCGRVTAALTNGSWGGMSREMLQHLPALRLVASSGVGYDSIDVAACTEAGVTVTNTPGVLDDDVADLAIVLMVSARRGLMQAHEHIRSGTWAQEGPRPLGSRSAGKRLGIAGYGRIGQAIARRAEAMSMEIAYYARSERPDSAHRFEPDLLRLAEWCDILVLALPGGAGTRGVVDGDVIRAIGPHGTLVNIARGSVVDETALIEALEQGALGSAGLDVFSNEPNVDDRLRALQNVALTPHVGSATVETRSDMAQLVVDNIGAFFEGRRPLTPVN